MEGVAGFVIFILPLVVTIFTDGSAPMVNQGAFGLEAPLYGSAFHGSGLRASLASSREWGTPPS